MGITKAVLKRPVATVMLILSIIVFGFTSLTSSKMELIPEMEMPMQVIYAIYPGANPEDIDKLVTQPIEDALGMLNGVDGITSYSNANMSLVLVSYDYGTDMDKAYNDLKKQMDSLRTLPEDVDPPTIMQFNMNEQPSMYLAINNDNASNLYNYVNDNVVPEFDKLSGVASVSVSGGREEYIKVELIPEKMAQYRLSMSQLAQAIGAADLAYPAGSTKVGNQSLNVTTGLSLNNIEDLKKVPIQTNGGIIYLQDVANVYSTLKKAAGVGRYNGKDTISVNLTKANESSAGQMSKQVKKVIKALEDKTPGLQIVVVEDMSDQINGALKTVFETMVAAVVISMLVIWLFFGDMKASAIVGTSIPLSILIALIGMSVLGYSINMITLGALVLGVGMIVDNSIVVLESCFRATKGKGFAEYRQAALEGSETVLMSIVGSTATTCVVFLPLAFLAGLSGQLFKPLGYMICFCLIASLISAMTIVPLCYVVYRPHERETTPLHRPVEALQAWYRDTMPGVLSKKKTVMLSSVALLVLSLVMATQLKAELIPATDMGQISVSAKLRPGVSVDKANEVLLRIEEYVSQDPDVETYMATFGSSGLSAGGMGGGTSATVTAYLKEDRKRSTDDIVKEWKPYLEGVTDTSVSVSASSMTSMMGGSSTSGIEYIMNGTDYDELKGISDSVIAELKLRKDVTKVHSSLENSAPIIKIEVDPLKASAEGLSAALVGNVVHTMLSGQEAATLTVDGNELSVMLEYPNGEYETVDQVKGIVVPNMTGQQVALTDIADVHFEDSPRSILRNDKQYQVTISAKFVDEHDAKEVKTISDNIYKEVVMPRINSGITRSVNSMDEYMGEEFASLGKAIAIAVFLVFVVMAAQFESPKFSIMVMTTIPFALIGSFGLLFLFNITISMPSLLGFLMLTGTVVNNGILYVDTANQYRMEMDRNKALVEAGATRIRPILMTTLTTVLSMVPLALGIGRSGKILQGLAMVNVGGLMASTILSLVMLPVYYTIMNKMRKQELDVD